MAKKQGKPAGFWRKFWHKGLRRPVTLKLAAEVKAKKPALTLVFLHGISATASTWRTTLREFSHNSDLENVRMLAFDLLGFGKSLKANWLDYDYFDYHKVLDATMKKYKVGGPVVIVGHSMGCLIAADYVTNHQPVIDVAGLILVSPPVLMPKELAKLPDQAYKKSYGSLSKLAKNEPAVMVVANFVQRFSNFSSKYLKTPAFERSMENIILNPQNYETFTKLRVPTLIIHGHFDPLVMRSNLKRVADVNPKYVRYVGVIGHHDISSQKRSKMLIEIKRILREQKHANL